MSMASGQRKLYNHIKLYYIHWGKTLFKNVGHDSVHTTALGVSLAASKTLFQNNFISSHIFSIYMISRSYYYCVLYSNYHNIGLFSGWNRKISPYFSHFRVSCTTRAEMLSFSSSKGWRLDNAMKVVWYGTDISR